MTSLPKPLVYLDQIAPTVLQDIRYATAYNFVGRPIAGYQAARCIVSEPLGQTIAAAQTAARAAGYTLKVYDGYRPFRAVQDFMHWCETAGDERMRVEFYPTLAKPQIVSAGYLSPKSVHCTGSAVDLTLVALSDATLPMFAQCQPQVPGDNPIDDRSWDNGIDMGTVFDYFGPAAHTAATCIAAQAQDNRQRLVALMAAQGLVNFAQEWWHFSLPNPPTSELFDVPIV